MGTVDDPPWAGLWAFGDTSIIVIIQEDFTVELHTYETEEALRSAWTNFEKTIENPTPDGNDVIIWFNAEGDWRVGVKWDYPAAVRWGYPTKESAVRGAAVWAHNAATETYNPDIWLFEDDRYYLLDWERMD